MRTRRLLKVADLVVAGLFVCTAAVPAFQAPHPAVDEIRRLFPAPPADSRIMMRWWWFGPAVTKSQLEREMRLMKIGGIGGFMSFYGIVGLIVYMLPSSTASSSHPSAAG